VVVEALMAGRVLARSEDTVVVEGNHYFPVESVTEGVLRRSRMKSLCPWKGVASYYSVHAGEVVVDNGAWTYRHPSPLARRIKNRVAFHSSVDVREVR
jgi:uncharacterized protein (DUF427 family)